ncbi:ATP-grasp fold amidoligase family protein [Roseomonas sp. AR75]|uniref:ATP-grasp fold amidoligase family protein n=1 Tax=Roseomonas sp. AR75 TaxID=2562311 RepID=UPI0010C0CE9A|nr:ATP-grasp fold amidoligase family protein [Roseomonas sp. AR75]
MTAWRALLRPLVPARLRRWRQAIRRVRADYRAAHGHAPHLFRPRRFNEKMQWRKLFDLDPRLALFSDKLATRDHVVGEVGRAHVAPLLWSGSDPDAMPLETLPTPFIVKSSHGSGDVVLVRDRARLDAAALRATARGWLATCHGTRLTEPGYVHVPRRLVVEALLRGHGGAAPVEYKVMCFGGRPHSILCVVAPDGPVGRRTAFHAPDWQPLPFRHAHLVPIEGTLPRPEALAEMLAIAARLAAGVSQLRVDLYDTAEGIVVGELTAYHLSGLDPFVPDAADLALGAAWPLRFPLLRALWTMATREHAIPAWRRE